MELRVAGQVVLFALASSLSLSACGQSKYQPAEGVGVPANQKVQDLADASKDGREKYSKEWETLNAKFKNCCSALHDKNVQAEEVLQWAKTESLTPLFVDVRKPEEQAVSMLPGAVPFAQFKPEMGQGRKVVFYCTIGYRSGEAAAAQAKRAGLDAHNLIGGIYGWTYHGGKIYAGEKEVTRVHVYSQDWDYLRPDYESVR